MTEAEPTIEDSGQSVESIEKELLQSVDLEPDIWLLYSDIRVYKTPMRIDPCLLFRDSFDPLIRVVVHSVLPVG